ncbi:uncharacterized protein LOC105201247 [Solenopsis invicta]|uniref:uncharacterized protein LOC105201247 n=1 Tax=Solenopsis invicta TaxID=13686 RepID=UPI00193D2922|nr:uncharacterized protein LOC105201247 [Solenopsis invicta]
MSGRQSKSYKLRKDCKKSNESRAVCKDSIQKYITCESKSKKRCKKRDIGDKEREKCTGNNRKRSNSCRRRNSSRVSDKSCSKVEQKRRYSQQSIFSVPRDHKSFSTLIPDIVFGMNVSNRLYASCSKDDRNRKQGPSCEKRKRTCETKEKNKIKGKCVKSPAKCMSRKKTNDKKTFCQSTQKDADKKFCQSTQKDTGTKFCETTKSKESIKKSNREEFCINRKKQFTKDGELKKEPIKACTTAKDKKKESAKAPPRTTAKDKKPEDQSIKQQIEREYKEIEECKKSFKKEKKDDKAKMVFIDNEPTGLDRIVSSREKQQKDSEKFASIPHESIVSTDTAFKWFNIQSRIFNGKISINRQLFAKDVRLFNVIFDRLFSTAKLDYQDDFAIERTMNHDKIAQNYSANSDDFVHGDELPNYVEIEYEDEEDDVYD